MRIALGIEYDGTGYVGWQRQKSGVGIQERVEAAIAAVANETVEARTKERIELARSEVELQILRNDGEIELYTTAGTGRKVNLSKLSIQDADGNPYPTYRCLFPQAPSEENVFNCSEVGVLGAVAGVMGTLQAVEVLKEITGAGDSMAGNLTIYDALGGRFQNITLKWDPNNPLSGQAPTITDLSSHAAG